MLFLVVMLSVRVVVWRLLLLAECQITYGLVVFIVEENC